MMAQLMRRLSLPAALLLAACTSPAPNEIPASIQPTEETAISAQQGLPTARLQILSDEGQTRLEAEVEIAERPESRRIGLMGVSDLPERAGMVFLWEVPHQGSFHMLNTLIPLDIAFWDEARRIVGIEQMQPCETEPSCPTYGPEHPYIGAVELNEGELSAAGVEEGDTVALER